MAPGSWKKGVNEDCFLRKRVMVTKTCLVHVFLVVFSMTFRQGNESLMIKESQSR